MTTIDINSGKLKRHPRSLELTTDRAQGCWSIYNIWWNIERVMQFLKKWYSGNNLFVHRQVAVQLLLVLLLGLQTLHRDHRSDNQTVIPLAKKDDRKSSRRVPVLVLYSSDLYWSAITGFCVIWNEILSDNLDFDPNLFFFVDQQLLFFWFSFLFFSFFRLSKHVTTQ